MPFARWSALPSGNHLSEQNIRLCDCTSGLLRRKGHWWSLWDWPRWIPDMASPVIHNGQLFVQIISSGEILPSTFKLALGQVCFLQVSNQFVILAITVFWQHLHSPGLGILFQTM